MPFLQAIRGDLPMRTTIGLVTALFCAIAVLTDAGAADGKIAIVAAENFYGDVAQQIGGDQVSVDSILSNPDQDPHLFETAPSVIREIAASQVVIYNGADYDPWMERLLEVTPKPGRVVIVAADLMHKKAGDNPHLWYDPATMPAVAKALAAALSAADPAHADHYTTGLRAFLASLPTAERQGRRNSWQVCRRHRGGNRAGIWLHGSRPASDDARAAASSSQS